MRQGLEAASDLGLGQRAAAGGVGAAAAARRLEQLSGALPHVADSEAAARYHAAAPRGPAIAGGGRLHIMIGTSRSLRPPNSDGAPGCLARRPMDGTRPGRARSAASSAPPRPDWPGGRGSPTVIRPVPRQLEPVGARRQARVGSGSSLCSARRDERANSCRRRRRAGGRPGSDRRECRPRVFWSGPASLSARQTAKIRGHGPGGKTHSSPPTAARAVRLADRPRRGAAAPGPGRLHS